jgi:hypothetical protein
MPWTIFKVSLIKGKTLNVGKEELLYLHYALLRNVLCQCKMIET